MRHTRRGCCQTLGTPGSRSVLAHYSHQSFRRVSVVPLFQGPKLTECFHRHCFHASLFLIIRLFAPCHALFRHRPRPTTPHQLSFESFIFQTNMWFSRLQLMRSSYLLLPNVINRFFTIAPCAATHHRPYCMSILQVRTCDVCIIRIILVASRTTFLWSNRHHYRSSFYYQVQP